MEAENHMTPILYHDDEHGIEIEAKGRRELEAIVSEFGHPGEAPLRMLNPLVDIPNTTDVLGVLRGNVELSVTHKPLGRCIMADLQRLADFRLAFICLNEVEGDFLAEVAQAMPNDGQAHPEIVGPMLQAFRSQVNQKLQERIQQPRDLDAE
jgi:hypothetical protein